MKATDIRRGHVMMIDGQPCRVMDFTHRTPGNLRAFVQVRFRNLVTGNTFDVRLAATDFVDEAPLETKEFQVLYRDQGGVHLMDTTSYEQHTLDAEAIGDHGDWLQPEMHIQVEWLNGRPVGIELPSVVELTVVQTSPVMRSATKTASTKPAKLSNGVTIQVRSEEHTSELQSQSNLVCRLLLEKKKKPTLCDEGDAQWFPRSSCTPTRRTPLATGSQTSSPAWPRAGRPDTARSAVRRGVPRATV